MRMRTAVITALAFVAVGGPVAYSVSTQDSPVAASSSYGVPANPGRESTRLPALDCGAPDALWVSGDYALAPKPGFRETRSAKDIARSATSRQGGPARVASAAGKDANVTTRAVPGGQEVRVHDDKGRIVGAFAFVDDPAAGLLLESFAHCAQ